MIVKHIPCGPAVNESERKAFEQLKGGLIAEPGDDEWLLLTNLAFSATHRLQSQEIDIVAIGPPGAQVIEVKHWTAAWVRQNFEHVEREADRVTEKARKIGTTLRKRVGNLPRVDGVFLVTGAAAKVGGIGDRGPVRGIPFHTLKTWRDAVGFHAKKVLSPEQIRMLSTVLEPGSAVALDGTLRQIAGYVRLTLRTSPEQRFHRVYDATHISRQDRVKLHLYDLSACDHARAEERAEREWKALQRLQLHGWAPRIVDSFQDAPGYPGEIKFFTLADPGAPSIKERSVDASWDIDARLDFTRNAVRALRELHEANSDGDPLVHRNLTSGTILVKHDNTPILTGFEHTRIPTDISVASPAATNEWEIEVAPEIRAQGRGAADNRSDIYSLCASLAVLFKDREDEASASVAEVLARGMDETPERRSSLSDLEKCLSALLGESRPEPAPPSARFWTEDQIVSFRGDSYRIVSSLGSGGVGRTFKVVKLDRKTGDDLGAYVAKVARDEANGRRVLRAYELVRAHLRHSALSTIFEVAPEWTENSFVALMTWIEGEPLGEYASLLSLLAEELHQESDEALAFRWLRTTCEALRVLHDKGLIHGDVSPSNMIVSGTDLVLTDYDCVTRIGELADSPGTVPYCSPSYTQGRDATPSDDLYALAASFFRALFDREPFLYDGNRAKERGLNWNGLNRNDYPLLSEFLDRATDPDPEKRFASVADALEALSQPQRAENRTEDTKLQDSGGATDQVEPTPPAVAGSEQTGRHKNEVKWLKSLLQSYPGSLWGNSETRGLDTDFAVETYVETDLEYSLYHDIVERRVSLVILCGNAGDGKTALLQHLAKEFELDVQTSATRILEGWLDSGLSVRMNLDGSASWQDRSADDLLDEFLKPFLNGRPAEKIAHLLAINDGRLLEWIENVEERSGEKQLTKDLFGFLENGQSPSESHIRFVNLNRRSLVGGIADDGENETDFLNRLVDSLYGGDRAAEIWAPCRTCSSQESCEVFRATRVFGPGELADEAVRGRARLRLFELLQAVHLRGETHITVRELRATLVYILFGIHYCSGYHAVADGSGPPIQPYWDRAFSPGSPGRQGEVLRELPRFDPALEAHPQIDRFLLHPPSGAEIADFPRPEELNLESARRYAYFRWTPESLKLLAHDPDALGLAGGRHLRQFRDLAVIDDETRIELVSDLCGGISRLEALPPLALDRSGVVPLRISPRTPTETAFWVEKSLSDFRLEADVLDGGGGLDRLHRHAFLIYRYRDGREERLRIGADLFHLLLELNEGYQLGDVASDDTFAHLSIFVQRLVYEDHRQMLAWSPMREGIIFEIAAKFDETESDPRQRLSIMQIEQPRKSNVE